MDSLEKVIQIADDNDILVLEYHLPEHNGMALEDGKALSVAVSPRVTRGNRRKAARVIGEEVGHCITGSFYGKKAKYASIEQCERIARRWLVEETISRSDLMRYLRRSDDDYWGAAEEFDVDIDTIIDACNFYFGIEPAAIRARLGMDT